MDQTNCVDNLVSVITPVYNSARFVAETIRSVQSQTDSNWEMILVDDCSTDSSAEIIASFAKSDSRIHYIKLAQNSGAAAARNRALAQAHGRYVAFVDADDIWLPDKLRRQLDLMRRKSAGFCYAAIEMIDENGTVVKPKRPVRAQIGYRFLLSNTMIACSSVVIDRGVTGDFRMPDVRKGQDFATWLMLLRNGLIAHGINEVMVRYRLVSGSVSSNKLGALKRTWRIYREQEKLNFVRSVFHFCLYTLHALKKYLF
jgi:teichuronic acid biosynthesis glycosyltransferase TuaG